MSRVGTGEPFFNRLVGNIKLSLHTLEIDCLLIILFSSLHGLLQVGHLIGVLSEGQLRDVVQIETTGCSLLEQHLSDPEVPQTYLSELQFTSDELNIALWIYLLDQR